MGRDFIVINGTEWDVELDGDDHGETLTTAADCPTCGHDDTSWTVDRRGYCGEEVFAVCEGCGNEYRMQWEKSKVSA